MKYFNYKISLIALTFSMLTFGAFAQNKTKPKSVTPVKKAHVLVKIKKADACQIDTLRLFVWEGIQVVELTKALPLKNDQGMNFVFMIEQPVVGNYYIGTTMQDMRPVLLGEEAEVVFTGVCGQVNALTVEKSDINKGFDALIDSIRTQSNEFFGYITAYQENISVPEALQQVNKNMEGLDFRRKELLLKNQKISPVLGNIAALYTYLSYQNNRKGPEQTEGEYLGDNFFKFTNLEDVDYLRIPFFFEAIKNYSNNMVRVGLTEEQVAQYFEALLQKVGEKNAHYKSALLAITFGQMGANNNLFLEYAKKYNSRFKGDNVVLDNFMAEQIKRIRGAAPEGEEAPDFSATTPDGKELSLKELRGKVVLVDFWASWCGPCRRENPHVVSMYNHYKDKGFEILGVSLDTDKSRWVDAIEKDGLKWYHISDLKGWQSAPAQLYDVKGIPFTLLLDKNGVVIAKNLRGEALERKLKEVLGE